MLEVINVLKLNRAEQKGYAKALGATQTPSDEERTQPQPQQQPQQQAKPQAQPQAPQPQRPLQGGV